MLMQLSCSLKRKAGFRIRVFTHEMCEAGQFDLFGSTEGALNVTVDEFESSLIQVGIPHRVFARTLFFDENPPEEIDDLVLIDARIAQRQLHGAQGGKAEFRRLGVIAQGLPGSCHVDFEVLQELTKPVIRRLAMFLRTDETPTSTRNEGSAPQRIVAILLVAAAGASVDVTGAANFLRGVPLISRRRHLCSFNLERLSTMAHPEQPRSDRTLNVQLDRCAAPKSAFGRRE
jgi:hypothetical protein